MYKVTGFKRAFLLILAAALLVVLASVLYWRQVTDRLSQDARTVIVSSSRELADNFSRLLGAEFRLLSTVAVSLQDSRLLENQQALVKYLDRQNKNNAFTLMGYQGPDGRAVFSNGGVLPDFISAENVETVYKQKHYISGRRKGPFTGKDILVFAVPMPSLEGEKTGVVFATQTIEFYARTLSANATHGEGLAFILNRKGDVIIAYPRAAYGNVFEAGQHSSYDRGKSALRTQQEITRGESGWTGYTLDGEHRFASYYPLRYNDWFAMAVLPTKSVAEQAQRLVLMSLVLFSSIIVVLGVLLVFILRMQSQSSRALFRMGFVDPLTETDNLNAFRFKFSRAAEAFKKKGIPYALVMVNVNRFKAVNDIYGFEQGDQVLKQVAAALRAGLEKGELFCRSSSDIFLLLLACPDRTELGRRVDSLAERAGRYCRSGGECLPLSLTCGIYLVDEDVPFYIMMDRANLAWASAKQHAGQVCAFYDEQSRRQIVIEKRIESIMDQALRDGEFKIYLQPKCDFKTGLTRSAEALVRWQHPTQGLVPPDQFIPVFEKNGFVLKLDMFMLQQTLQLLKAWKEQGKPVVPIGVNFSRLHLEDPQFIDVLARMADEYGVEHHLLEVELTESVVFGNVELMKNVIDSLHAKGFSVAMDDFGSGYSSLNVLKNLDFDCVKLDKEFLVRGEGNPRMRQIISGLVRMIKSLGSGVVAEGVETAEQAEFLSGIGCDLAQGYYFSRPLPPEDFALRLAQEKEKNSKDHQTQKAA